MKGASDMLDRTHKFDENLIVNFSPKSSVAECYRILRTNLQFLGVDKPLRSILITSSLPGDGKTFTACNLALAMSQSGSEVILADADLRKPCLHKIFGLDNRIGLTTVLAGEIELGDALRTVDIPNLKVLASGPVPPNPADLLGSPRMDALLRNMVDMSQTIILDSTPVIAVTDGLVLSTMVDGVVLVVGAKKVTCKAAQRAKAMLDQVGARLLGAVLNRVSSTNETYHYSYYYGEDDEKSVKRSRR